MATRSVCELQTVLFPLVDGFNELAKEPYRAHRLVKVPELVVAVCIRSCLPWSVLRSLFIPFLRRLPAPSAHAPFDAFASDDFRTDARASEHVHRPGTQLELVFHIADEIPVPGDPFLTALVNGVETAQVLAFLGIEWLVAWPCLRFGRFILPCCNASCFKSSFMPSARTWVGVM